MSAECGTRSAEFDRLGFGVFNRVASSSECDRLAAELSAQFDRQQSSSRNKIGGVRNLLQNQQVAAVASSASIASLLAGLIGKPLFPVRAIFFDKTEQANWRVPWHQDLAIAVAGRIETAGFSGWSVKEGIDHVQPPREILEQMVAIRLHLDDCDAMNGALKVVPGSHRHGRLDAQQIDRLVQDGEVVTCEVSKGGVLLMRPLLLHSSSPSKNPSHRRVLHIEYAADELPNGLKWFERQ
jgi:ectoine hydroxylase-related dioxygenase (phytanoyl-CoA dioxygenase family)